MFGFLILFLNKSIDLKDITIQEWLKPLALKGSLLSIDNLDRAVALHDQAPAQELPLKSFAIINARSTEEVYTILKQCPKIAFEDVKVFQLND